MKVFELKYEKYLSRFMKNFGGDVERLGECFFPSPLRPHGPLGSTSRATGWAPPSQDVRRNTRAISCIFRVLKWEYRTAASATYRCECSNHVGNTK